MVLWTWCYTVILTDICLTCLFTFNTLKDWLFELKAATGQFLTCTGCSDYRYWYLMTGVQGHCVEVWPYEVDVHRGLFGKSGHERRAGGKCQSFVDIFYGWPVVLLSWQDITGWGENDRGVSFTFGGDVVRQFLKKHSFSLIARAHQVCSLLCQWLTNSDISSGNEVDFAQFTYTAFKFKSSWMNTHTAYIVKWPCVGVSGSLHLSLRPKSET